MSAPRILGIDGGGSKTLVALAERSGEVVRIAIGPGVNPMDQPEWQTNLEAVARPLAGVAVVGVVAALPAYGEVDAISARQQRAVAGLAGGEPHRVVNDVEAAHYGAFAGGPGILVLSGTGSMAWAVNGAGGNVRVGGWGEALGDEGSAYWIGMRALRLAARAIDGRIDAPGLVDGLLRTLDLGPAQPQDALMGWYDTLPHPRSAVAALAPAVGRLAEAGEPVALAIFEDAAGHLAGHVRTAARRIGAASPLRWSFAGGTFGSVLLRSLVTRQVGDDPVPAILPPIGGALLRAARDLDWPVDQAWIGRLAASIENNAPHARNGRNENPLQNNLQDGNPDDAEALP